MAGRRPDPQGGVAGGDLALITRDLLDWSPGHAERLLSAYGLPPTRVDRSRIAFYRLRDEFF